MIKTIVTLSLVFAFANAEISLKDINSKPSSRAKNFMIWQYFKQDITPSQADEAFYQLDGVTNKLFFAYAKKSDHEEIKFTASCMKKKDLLEIDDNDCLELAMSPYKTLNLSNKQREELSQRVNSKVTKDYLSIQNEPYKQSAYKKYSPSTILTAFISTSVSHRRENLNMYLSRKFMNDLASSWKISQFIKTVVSDSKLHKLQKSLFHLKGDNLNSQNNFFLALNNLKYANNEDAMKHFQLSYEKARFMIDKDKNIFWMYKTTKDKKYLNELLSSKDINIYTIYAHEISKKEFKNYYSSVETTDEEASKDIKDPFNWNAILKEIKQTPKEKLFDLASSYNQNDMVPVQSYIIQKAHNSTMHGYVMPYNKYLNSIDNDEKALVYAIMRQESNLIPSALSRSYALGLMQLMPFVVDDLSTRQENPIKSYDEMFVPEKNISYALKHIEWMKKSLYHPLFMAYAYNGGMGFLRRHLQTGTFNSGKYEPFLSMELMSNTQSREYGKRVLANYVMYKKVMGENISIVDLFDTLTQPKMTDRFRGQG